MPDTKPNDKIAHLEEKRKEVENRPTATMDESEEQEMELASIDEQIEEAKKPVKPKSVMELELEKLEAERLALKKQTPEQAKERDPEEYGRIKGRIAELKAALEIA